MTKEVGEVGRIDYVYLLIQEWTDLYNKLCEDSLNKKVDALVDNPRHIFDYYGSYSGFDLSKADVNEINKWMNASENLPLNIGAEYALTKEDEREIDRWMKKSHIICEPSASIVSYIDGAWNRYCERLYLGRLFRFEMSVNVEKQKAKKGK